ncbi:MAG: hypothetical protein IIW91_07800 [Alistipes sp.]|jgi:hypothetical protein|nr:hypothetical protein [Alistipes sp.]
MTLKTKRQKVMEAREAAIYKEWHRLRANPNSMKTAIAEALMEKYDIYSRATVYQIVKRVERRMNKTNN